MKLMERLENIFRGQAIVFDTCALSPHETVSLTESLYHGLGGLSSVQFSTLEERIKRISQMNLLLSKPELVVIDEVEKEVKEHFRIVNTQCEYLSDAFILSTYSRWKSKSGKKRGKRGTGSKKIDLLKHYRDEFFHFANGIRNRGPRKYLSIAHHDSLVGIAESYSKDLKRLESGRKMNLETPVLIGEKLNTDVQIIATAFTLAYEKDVLILTTDKKLGDRVWLIT